VPYSTILYGMFFCDVTRPDYSFLRISFLGSAWNKPGFETLARSWFPGARFLDSGLQIISLLNDHRLEVA